MMPPPALPVGAMALLFSDIEGSTALLNAVDEAYLVQFAAHARIMRVAFAAHGGLEINNQGDSFFAVFPGVPEAVAAAAQIQRDHYHFSWSSGHPLRVRIGVHHGEPIFTSEGYVGEALHRGARVMRAGHGGQTLLSGVAAVQLKELPACCQLRDAGQHYLKDLPVAEQIFELCIADLPSEFPPLHTLRTQPRPPPHNLPSHLPPILGRQHEIEAIRAVLQSGASLTTLLGPGGTGKTRLALEIAATTLETWEDGVFFVSLASLFGSSNAASGEGDSVEDVIIGAVARELNLRDEGQQSVAEQLTAYLKPRQMLLVLDNFEHLVQGASVVAGWMAECPRLQILATSRVPLRLRGERETPIAPLALPPRNPLPRHETLSNYAAVALFVECAKAVKPEFEINEHNAEAVAEICARIDGLPLAIELAAARIKLLPPTAMLARLERSLNFLTGGARETSTRQQTLRDTIAWSYQLLGENEKQLFSRLGVFRGSFTVEDAEQVCAAPVEHSAAPLDAFDGISLLLDHSLLAHHDQDEGEARWEMLQTIREFALETLEARGECERLRERHWQWCHAQTIECSYLVRYDFSAALRRFEAVADNWRAAWSWSLEARPHDALRLASHATLLWNSLGAVTEQYERLEASLQAAPDAEVQDRCRALHYLIQADRNRADWERYRPHLAQLERELQDAQIPEFQAIALDQRMWDAVAVHDIKAAMKMGNTILHLRRLSVEQAQAQSLDEREIARRRFELDDASLVHAEILTKSNRVSEAYLLVEQILARKRASDDQTGLTLALYRYAQLLMTTEHTAEARVIFEEVVQRGIDLGDRSTMLAWYSLDAAHMALRESDLERARELICVAYAVFKKNGVVANAQTIHLLAWLHALENHWPLVARLVGAADPERGARCEDEMRAILEDQRGCAQAALGEDEFAKQETLGRLNPQQAIEAALNDCREYSFGQERR